MAEPAALLQVLTADLGGGDAFGELVAAVITARLARAGWCDHDHLVAPALRQTLRGGWKGPGMGLDHESSRGASAVVVFEAVLISGLTQDFRGIGARIAVAADQHLTVLHDAIQEAFGWLDDHLYAFWLDGRFWSDDAVEYTSPYTVDSPSQTAEVPIFTLEVAVGAELAYYSTSATSGACG